MFQQIIALIIISYFIARLVWQRKNHTVSSNEFIFWLIFWLLASMSIILLHSLDELVARLGFSATGIDVLLYLSIALLFYFLFRVRLRLEKMEKNITKIVRTLAVSQDDSGISQKKN